MRAILTYHSIDDSGSVISVSEAAFRRHVEWLSSGAVDVVSLSELLTLSDDATAIALTFDDGLVTFGERAAPLLLEAGLPATVYVVSERVGGMGEWSGGLGGLPALPLLGWDALARVSENGLIDLGAHTRTHPALPCLDRDGLEAEIAGSADDIERETGQRPSSFAYPYGHLDDACVQLASESFSSGVSTRHAFLTGASDAIVLPRLDMWYFRAPSALDSFGSMAFRSSVHLRRIARNVKRSFRGAPCE
jgi:peptidoglycan/xylan/chitin deacetylase (PgdA/CDA1 family)